MFEMIASIAGPLLGGMMQSDSAGDAAEAQTQATQAASKATLQAQREAIAEQRRQYDQSRADLAPYRDVGGNAILTLGQLMGLRGGTQGGAQGGQAAPARSWEDFYREALTRAPEVKEPEGIWLDHEGTSYFQPTGPGKSSQNTDWARSEADRMFQSQPSAPVQPSQTMADVDASGVFDSPLNRKFTVSDFYADPVTQLGMEYGLNEGRKAIDLGAGAAGLRNSGATLKALTQFGTDYAGTKANESRSRFIGDQDTVFNRLSGMSGTGQTASNATASAGANAAGNISSTLMSGAGRIADLTSSMGNARGAAAIAGGNAWGNAFDTIGNWWNQKNTMDRIFPKTQSASYWNEYVQ